MESKEDKLDDRHDRRGVNFEREEKNNKKSAKMRERGVSSGQKSGKKRKYKESGREKWSKKK